MDRPRLKPADHLRIVAPSRSMTIIGQKTQDVARQRLESLGLTVSYGDNVFDVETMNSGSVQGRVDDLHQAFADPDIAGILTVIGGFNSNQLLKHLDFDLIRANPKVFCGFSDISVLNNALYAKAGLVTYSGPHFSSFGMEHGLEYTLDYFQQCLMSDTPVSILASDQWSDDPWFMDQENRTFIDNPGMAVVNTGKAQGRPVCSNVSSFNLLHGTEWMPSFKDTILFLEMANDVALEDFDRRLQSLILQPDFAGVKGVVVGRFQKGRLFDDAELIQVLKSKPELGALPVIIGADFGHTTPTFTFPIGGQVSITAVDGQQPELQIL